MAIATRETPGAAAATQLDSAPSHARGRPLPAPAAIALAAVRAAALACHPLVGRGDRHAADGAATAAMRESLAAADARSTVVIGEGEKDEAPMLFAGEELGRADTPAFDVAVDPLEGTKVCAAGVPGALATIALAPAGSLWRPGPSPRHSAGRSPRCAS
jgi:fructose-1,6-bisphosphatase II